MTIKERPILFSTPMVRAILDGRKTQTRRICKQAEKESLSSVIPAYKTENGEQRPPYTTPGWFGDEEGDVIFYSPYGEPGDRLWVRETFWAANDTCDHEYCSGCNLGSLLSLGAEYAQVQYVASPLCCTPPELTGTETYSTFEGNHSHGYWWLSPPEDWDGERDYHGEGNWIFLPTPFFTKHPSIHMPRWASRILLEITNVRVERLNDISEEDAIAEGLQAITKDSGKTIKYGIPDADGYPGTDNVGWPWHKWNTSPVQAYKKLWESINGQGSWDLKPWVWVIEFKEVKKECFG